MPIEIRELEIRVAVSTGAQTGAKAVQGGPHGAASADARGDIIAECVDQVLRILESKKER